MKHKTKDYVTLGVAWRSMLSDS